MSERTAHFRPEGTSGWWRQVWCVAWSPDGKAIGWAGGDGVVRVRSAISGTRLWEHRIGHPVTDMEWSPNGAQLIVGGWSSSIIVLDAKSSERITSFDAGLATVYGLSLSPSGKQVALAGESGRGPAGGAPVPIVEIETGTVLVRYTGHTGLWTQSVDWSPDGHMLASAGLDDSTTQVWRAITAEMVTTCHLPGDMKEVYDVAWSRDGAVVASATQLGLRINDALTGQLLHQDRGRVAPSEVDWSPDGRFLGIVRNDGQAQLYDPSVHKVIHKYARQGKREDQPRATSLAWAPDSAHVAIGYSNGDVRMGKLPHRFLN